MFQKAYIRLVLAAFGGNGYGPAGRELARKASRGERGANSCMIVEEPGFWLAVLQIIWIDVLLSGDNAVVIALACRKLPPNQRIWGMVLGTMVAISFASSSPGW